MVSRETLKGERTMNKYYVRFAWYKDMYLSELANVRKYFVKATSEEIAVHIACERCDIDTNEIWIDEINIRDLNKPRRKHKKKRYNVYELKSM